MKRILVVLVLCSICFQFSYAQDFGKLPKIKKEKLLNDLEILYQGLDKFHSGMYWYTPKDSVDMALLKGPAHMAWMQQLGEAQTAAKEMVKAQDISGMRAAFETLSDTLYASIQQFGTSGSLTIYRFHCPMAFNNRGAYWLQQSEQTENPYYGSKMFRCGTKTETLATGTQSKKEHDHE